MQNRVATKLFRTSYRIGSENDIQTITRSNEIKGSRELYDDSKLKANSIYKRKTVLGLLGLLRYLLENTSSELLKFKVWFQVWLLSFEMHQYIS